MHAIFLADAHLHHPEDRNYRLILSFLDGMTGKFDLLVIMGDLFDFWIGYPVEVFPQYRLILDRLNYLKSQGVRIIYCEGNHDFHLGPFFTETLGVEVFPGPSELLLDGMKVHLCHGDQVNHHDLPVRLLRKLLHGPLIPALIPLVPSAVALAIARVLNRRSNRLRDYKKQRFDPRNLVREYAMSRFSAGYSAVVTGHFHTPFIETVGDKTILSVGDWITDFSWGEFQNGTFSLRSYDPGLI